MPSRGTYLFRALRVLVLLVATLGLLLNSLTVERLSETSFLWIYVPFIPLTFILGNYIVRSFSAGTGIDVFVSAQGYLFALLMGGCLCMVIGPIYVISHLRAYARAHRRLGGRSHLVVRPD